MIAGQSVALTNREVNVYDESIIALIGAVLVALVSGPVTIWFRRRKPKLPPTTREIQALRNQVSSLEATVAHQDSQITQMLEQQRAMAKDITDLRDISRRMSKEIHLYRAAVGEFIIAYPEHAQWWLSHRSAIDSEMAP